MKLYCKFFVLIFLISAFFSCSDKKIAKSNNEIGLKNLVDFPIGSAISIRDYGKNKKLDSLHYHNFNSITATNTMKMYSVASDSTQLNFEGPDRMLAIAQEHNYRLFGHTLIWHSGTPEWIKDLAKKSPKKLDEFMKNYIHTYVGRYKGKVDAWDVVNEGLNTVGGDYRETIWYKALGKEYIANAFRYAHEADPDALLFYNDFNIERDTAKFHGVLKMVEDLKSQGVPISGIGFQMHIRMDTPNETIAYTLQEAAKTGLKIHLSEVDIIFNKHDDTRGGGVQIYNELTEEMKQQQADKYRDLALMYRKYVPKEQRYGITFWRFTDKYSWIDGFFKLNDWPCLFDDDLNEKPAYFGFVDGLTKKIN